MFTFLRFVSRLQIFAVLNLVLLCGAAAGFQCNSVAGESLRISTFDIDVTPPVGSWMAYDPVTNKWDLGLRGRGIVILGSGDPIVLCAMDWIGIANESQDAFHTALARVGGTTPNRVAVHTLHQHDAPDCDFSAERILKEAGMDTRQYEGVFHRQVIADLEIAVRKSLTNTVAITHVGLGEAIVSEVASNRRIRGKDGKMSGTRWTASPDAAARAEPEGVIDPKVSLISFWNTSKPVAVLSFYATHPQSYYRTGFPNPDIPGVARFMRQMTVPGALHVHFNGAGGNIGAGKYNDGSPENRLILAQRLAEGMKRAWESTKRTPINSSDIGWELEPVALPVANYLTEDKLKEDLRQRGVAAVALGVPAKIGWVQRRNAGRTIDAACLRLGNARALFMPGELFVEYQLAAKTMRPDLFVAMAAYGDYAPGYVGTAAAYEEGGYETSPASSNVAPEVEAVLMKAMRKLLHVKE